MRNKRIVSICLGIGVIILFGLYFWGEFFYWRIYERWIFYQARESSQAREAYRREFSERYPESHIARLTVLRKQKRKIKQSPIGGPGNFNYDGEIVRKLRQDPELLNVAIEYLHDSREVSELISEMRNKVRNFYIVDRKEVPDFIADVNSQTKQFMEKYPDYFDPIERRIIGLRAIIRYFKKAEDVDQLHKFYRLYENFVQKVEERHPQIVEDELWQYRKEMVEELIEPEEEEKTIKLEIDGEYIEFERVHDFDRKLYEKIRNELGISDSKKLIEEYMRRSPDIDLQD